MECVKILPWLLPLGMVLSTAAHGQTKIEERIGDDFRSRGAARVLIVTRPDPAQPGGGASLSSPAGYISSRLGTAADNVRAIGSLSITTAEIKQEAIAILQEDPNVARVIRDVPVPSVLMDSTVSIGAEKVHKQGIKGTSWNVAVLDTGIQVDHPALKNAVVAEACFSTRTSQIYKVKSLCPHQLEVALVKDSAGQCPPDVGGCEHGTHVGGIVAGRSMKFENKTFDGVAPGAGIVAVQVFTLFEDAEVCGGANKCILSFTSDQLRALDWVFKKREELKIAAVNMSLGGGYHDKPCDDTSALTETIERLRSKGVATVIAAGNSAFYDGVAEPACISAAITVAAMNKQGSIDVDYSNMSTQVDFAAPGTSIVSSITGSGYKALSGTSMSSPHVAATFALMREHFPTESVLQLQRRLLNGAPDVQDPRTGIKVASLEVVHAMVDQNTAAPVASVGPSGLPSAGGNSAVAGSFIVQTRKTESELRSTLNEGCPDLDCSVKEIAKGTYRLEVAPRSDIEPSKRESATMGKSDLERIFKDKGDDVRVFDNRAFAPLPNVGEGVIMKK
jgi:subtilisin family serine protease